MNCSVDNSKTFFFFEANRVYDLLACLNNEFNQVCVQIIGREQTPSLEETISLI